MISDENIERVRAAADIVEIISEVVPLKRHGGDYRGPCPFHNGTNPNFSVSPKRGSYHCFKCQESGDVFTFVRKRLGLDWPSAIKYVGERAGVEVVDTPRRSQVADPNEPHWATLASAAEWFRDQLASDEGAAARSYLASRGLDDDAGSRFGIGYAPRDPQALRRYFHTLGFDDARLADAGLIATRDGDAEPRSKFRARVMFPILDEHGHHVGFGGRALLPDAKPKYLNSAESGVFQKRRTLYGLNTARAAMRRAERGVVVEGYLDAIRLVLAGVEETVAPLGTALTDEQAELLSRTAGEVILLYDGDEAGQKATFRSALVLLAHRVAVRVASLPDGEDPDSYVRAHGRAGIEAVFAQAMDIFDRQVQVLERAGWFTDIVKRRRAIDKLLPTVRATRDDVSRDLYLTRLGQVSGVDKVTLTRELEQVGVRRRGSRLQQRSDSHPVDEGWTGGGEPPPPVSEELQGSTLPARPEWRGRRSRFDAGPQWRANATPPRAARDEPVERALIRAMVVDRALVEVIAERHGPEHFRHPGYRELFRAMLSADLDEPLDGIEARLDPEAVESLHAITDGLDAADPTTTDIGMSLRRMDARPLRARSDEIKRLIAVASADEANALLREQLELKKELKQLLSFPVAPRAPRT